MLSRSFMLEQVIAATIINFSQCAFYQLNICKVIDSFISVYLADIQSQLTSFSLQINIPGLRLTKNYSQLCETQNINVIVSIATRGTIVNISIIILQGLYFLYFLQFSLLCQYCDGRATLLIAVPELEFVMPK